MRALSWFFYALGGLTGLWILIATFGTWIQIWGVGGALFSIFLFPLAALAQPLGQWVFSGDPAYLWNYLDIAMFFLLMWTGSKLAEKAEEKARRTAEMAYKMQCPNCYAPVSTYAQFCGNCGAPL